MTETASIYLVELTKKLVSFNTIPSIPDETVNCLRFIKDFFKNTPFSITVTNKNDHPAILIAPNRDSHQKLILNGHIDIVDTGQHVTHIRQHEDKLFGEGTMDMKGGVACMMLALKKYYLDNEKMPSVCLMITSDEETGGRDGTEYLLKNKHYSADFALVCEGRSKYEIVTREKGLVFVKLIAHGTAAHGAYPGAGNNAILNLMQFIKEAEDDFPNERNAWASSFNVTNIQAGHAMNVVPDKAEAIADVRFTNDKRQKLGTLEEIKKYFSEKAPKFDIKVKYIVDGNELHTSDDNKHVIMLQKIASSITKRNVNLSFNHGSSDARFFQLYGTPVATLGPIGTAHHSPNEWVSIKSLNEHFEVVYKFIEQIEEIDNQ